MKYYLESNKLYINSTAIDADTQYTAGWFKNPRPELVNFRSLHEELMKHYNNIMMNELDKMQKEQLNNLTNPIKFDVQSGLIKAGNKNHPLKLCAPVITCSCLQRFLLMNILSKIPRNAFGNRINVILTSMKGHMHNDYYDAIVSKSIAITL